jgi:hypothetical protein
MITLRKIRDITALHQGLILRGVPTRVGVEMVTFKITRARGVETGADYTDLVAGRLITLPTAECDLYR